MIDDPKVFDANYWKYQGLLESYINTLKRAPYILVDDELFNYSLAHIAKKIYEIGLQDGAQPDTKPSLKDILNQLIVEVEQVLPEEEEDGILN